MSVNRNKVEQEGDPLSCFTIVLPLDPCLELSQTEVNLDTEYDRPVFLAILAIFRLGTTGQWGQIRADVTQRGEVF